MSFSPSIIAQTQRSCLSYVCPWWECVVVTWCEIWYRIGKPHLRIRRWPRDSFPQCSHLTRTNHMYFCQIELLRRFTFIGSNWWAKGSISNANVSRLLPLSTFPHFCLPQTSHAMSGHLSSSGSYFYLWRSLRFGCFWTDKLFIHQTTNIFNMSDEVLHTLPLTTKLISSSCFSTVSDSTIFILNRSRSTGLSSSWHVTRQCWHIVYRLHLLRSARLLLSFERRFGVALDSVCRI